MSDNRTMRAATVVIAVACLAAVAAAQSPAPPPARPPLADLKLQLNWLPEPEFGGIYAAELNGSFASHSLAVEILKGGPDVPAVQMAASGRVELAIAAADEVIALRARGADIVALYATYQTSPQAIMVKQSRPVNGLKAMFDAGGTLIAQPGLAYLKWLRANYDFSRTQVVPYGSGAMAQFLDPKATGIAMQCFLPAEPVTARRLGVDTKVFLIANTGFNPYTAVVVTRRDFLASHREACRGVVAALREGWRAYLDDPEPANRAMARLNPSMDLATFAEAAMTQRDLVESPDTRTLGLGAMNEQRWTTLARQLLDLGIIDVPVAPQDCFVNLD
jgi:NitT/TauT family transport system substrate-binding protein